jgi:hypothetical protein
MALWRVLLNGQNFHLLVDGEPTRVGFYATRLVDAEDAYAAELAAVQTVRDDARFGHILNPRSDSPMIFAEEVARVADSDAGAAPGGYTFYLDHEEADGQQS